MQMQRFRATVLSGHKEDAVEVPFDPGERWEAASEQIRPGRRGYRVVGEINGHRFESHVVARSNKFWLLLPARMEAAAKIDVGDAVMVKLEPAKPH
jgi:hypothetical protein